ncbi:SDR family oxidoreductase [Ahrensia sp. R2A130]|uniref:SDR family oxidoreductase n=1 Tax=Ahrensia sp. R2A130 TaxID=744979 RepID=UPI0001E08BE1|nr:SDR family oxidoreductase [Ahrensia sp. R2A130]EFL91060.1 short-chain dehydrogenase/reductase SDR [Ahrensia sp. R2A130]
MSEMSKIALVTGASSGIGRNAALSLCKAGWTVIGTGRRQDALDETAAQASGGEMVGIAADVTNEASVDNLFAEIAKRFGKLDFVFNNAGNNVPATNFGDLTLDQWNTVMSVNLNGAFLIANRAYAMMRDQKPSGGRIVNNGSISAHVPRPGSAPYTASKHAITGLTRCISLDGRPLGISCGQIDIGNAASDMTARMSGGVPQADGTMKSEPTMDVQNVGDAVVHMASLSPDANILFITVMANEMPFVGRG